MIQSHATIEGIPARCLRWIVVQVGNVLLLAGYSPQDTSTFLASFQERLPVVIDLALQLRTAIGEQVTSMDIIPCIVKPGFAFDPDTMDNTYTEGRVPGETRNAGELVAGSTELGLISQVKIADKVQEAIMLKPKVILYSALNLEG
jgi:hypothetical protein